MWPGRNVFCCGGRLMFGVDVKYFACSNVLIAVPVFMFLFFRTYPKDEMDYAAEVVLPYVGKCSVYAVALVALAVLCYYHLWKAALMDPGIILRRPVKTESGEGDDSSLPKGWSRHFDKKEGQP